MKRLKMKCVWLGLLACFLLVGGSYSLAADATDIKPNSGLDFTVISEWETKFIDV